MTNFRQIQQRKRRRKQRSCFSVCSRFYPAVFSTKSQDPIVFNLINSRIGCSSSLKQNTWTLVNTSLKWPLTTNHIFISFCDFLFSLLYYLFSFAKKRTGQPLFIHTHIYTVPITSEPSLWSYGVKFNIWDTFRSYFTISTARMLENNM